MSKRPPLTAAERRMLVHGTDEARAHFMDGRSRQERRRLEREAGKEQDREKQFANKLTTRADVIRILELYNGRKILPLAHRLDEAERYLFAPWWTRLWARQVARWHRLVGWLDTKGIRVRRTDAGTDTQQEEAS